MIKRTIKIKTEQFCHSLDVECSVLNVFFRFGESSPLGRQTRVVECAIQQIREFQLARPFAEVGAIQGRPLDLEPPPA